MTCSDLVIHEEERLHNLFEDKKKQESLAADQKMFPAVLLIAVGIFRLS